MKDIQIPVSPGELLDRISILRLKSERITNPDKLANIRSELRVLEHIADGAVPNDGDLAAPAGRLFEVNGELWNVEDALRDHEKRTDFGADFVRLARSVYALNDERAALKRQINDLLGSCVVEEKSYGQNS